MGSRVGRTPRAGDTRALLLQVTSGREVFGPEWRCVSYGVPTATGRPREGRGSGGVAQSGSNVLDGVEEAQEAEEEWG